MRWQRAVSVLLAALALFPVISASDDRLRLADLHAAAPPASAAFDLGQMHQAAPSFEAFFGIKPKVTPALRASLVKVLSERGK